MKQFMIALVVTAVIGVVLGTVFRGDRIGAGGAASAVLATAPAAPPTSATAYPTSTAAPASSGGGGGGSTTGGGPGQQLATQLGCAACHSTGGASGVGPTWKGIAGSQATLADGSTAARDDAYLRESITAPNAKVVKGFSPGIMPQNFGQSLTPDQINQLIEYIKTLK